ncbi:tRNA pseudouridine(38-40) synthase TruA [Algoriphagus aestuariicola]|uniref:tRNA pseudouridine synthase A n=1 Tax=Algoriphagus aestuariicola TaxID=1852016 RepID=A0ABS3BQY7_9BACT|nr:tRNA pseudouridine(38-40) synthase TruA [Algoriphagus aestuariicola]MBN7801707.1 tRNA pseudouridine(38-40) synthase TruA [Algoriphagus aestuariicola]
MLRIAFIVSTFGFIEFKEAAKRIKALTSISDFMVPFMRTRPYSYLFSISYFGGHFKGWAKQPNQATVEGKLERVFRYVLNHEDFSLIGASRTDSGVHCRSGYMQLFLREKIELENLLPTLNQNLGGEITLNSVREIPRDFNLIQAVEKKTYRYFFSDSPDFHPFASAYMHQVSGLNSLEKMEKNVSAFVGEHDFKAFCKVSPNKSDYVREVLEAKVYLTDEYQGEFFPERVYCFEVTGTGFLHHQVRKMVSAIWTLASDQIQERLNKPEESWEQIPPAPAHGLTLWETVLVENPGNYI